MADLVPTALHPIISHPLLPRILRPFISSAHSPRRRSHKALAHIHLINSSRIHSKEKKNLPCPISFNSSKRRSRRASGWKSRLLSPTSAGPTSISLKIRQLLPPIRSSRPIKHLITLVCSTSKIMRQARSTRKHSISTKTMIRPSVVTNHPLLPSASTLLVLERHPPCLLKTSHPSKKAFPTYSSKCHYGPRQLNSITSQKTDPRRMTSKIRALPSMNWKRVYTKKNRRRNRKENQPLLFSTKSHPCPTRQL
jgi:hypothetical protein